MTLSPRIYFDTNVFIALYEGDRSHVSPGLQLLERGQNRSQPAFATSELTLADADMADLLASSIPALAGTALRAVRPDQGSLAALLSLL